MKFDRNWYNVHKEAPFYSGKGGLHCGRLRSGDELHHLMSAARTWGALTLLTTEDDRVEIVLVDIKTSGDINEPCIFRLDPDFDPFYAKEKHDESNQFLLNKYARLSAGSQPGSQSRRKARRIVLDYRWVYDCIEARKFLGPECDYGGREIKGYIPTVSVSQSSRTRAYMPRGRTFPGLNAQETDGNDTSPNDHTSKTEERLEVQQTDSQVQQNFEKLNTPPQTPKSDGAIQGSKKRMKMDPLSKALSSQSTDIVPQPLSESHETTMTVPEKTLETPRLFISFGKPIGFYIAGNSVERMSTQLLIERSGGGVILPLEKAQIIVLPLQRSRTISSSEHIKMRGTLSLTQIMVSYEWIHECIKEGRMVDLALFRLE